MKVDEKNAANYQQGFEVSGDFSSHAPSKFFDADRRPKRTWTLWTASAHIITAVIGSGVLALAWATAQLGWIAGPTVLFLFSFVTYYCSCLLASCYCTGDPVTGKRNYTYMEAVKSNLDKLPIRHEYNMEHVNTLIAQASPFLRFPEEFLCWVGISRNYLLKKDTYPRFEYENGEEMDLNAFIRTADPLTLLPTSVCRLSGELSESIKREFVEDGSGGGGQEDASVAGHGNVRPVVPITDDIVVEADVFRPKRSKKNRVICGSEGTPAASHPPKRLRADYGRISGSTARVVFVVLYDSSHHSATNSAGYEGDSFVRSVVPVMTEATTVTTITTIVAIPTDVGKDKSKTVTKGFELNDGRSCANMIDHFTPPAFFKTVGRIEHEQLFAEFNVRRTQFKFDAPEVENACGRTFIFEGKGNGNKEESVVVPNSVIGFQLEAIEKGSPLRGNDRELSWLGNISSSSYGSQNHGLVSQVHELETSSARLREQLDLYEGNMKRRVDADSQVLYALRKEFPSATSSTSLAKQSEYLVSLDHPLSVEALIEPPVVVPATNALSSEGSLSVPIMVLLFPVDDYEKKSS
ncbi:amino acid transporter, transmembrane [Tanacetum coccineum]